MEARRKFGYTPFDKCAIAARATALGCRTPAVIIAARQAPKSGDFSASPSPFIPSSSQPTPRNQPSASAWKTKAAPLKVKSAAALESLLSLSSAIVPALRAHHSRKLFENSYVAGHCYFKAQKKKKVVSNRLAHGTGEKQKIKLILSNMVLRSCASLLSSLPLFFFSPPCISTFYLFLPALKRFREPASLPCSSSLISILSFFFPFSFFSLFYYFFSFFSIARKSQLSFLAVNWIRAAG
jgi:hypothetical protein